MEREEQLKYNFIFWVGVLFAVFGGIFNLWYCVLFGLVLMITARWIEKEKEEEDEEGKKRR